MSTCPMLTWDEHGYPGTCGMPLQGREPCVTCNDYEFNGHHPLTDALRVHVSHGLPTPGAPEMHIYEPSKYVCPEHGNVSKSALGSEASAPVSDSSAHVEQ